jgi:pimeloyl-ACP methyl ester carboxylesterase
MLRTARKLAIPMLAWAGRRSFGDHCFDCAEAIAKTVESGVIEECGHWVFEEHPEFITDQLLAYWSRHGRVTPEM